MFLWGWVMEKELEVGLGIAAPERKTKLIKDGKGATTNKEGCNGVFRMYCACCLIDPGV